MGLTILFTLGSFFVFYQITSFISRARASSSTFSKDNSYLFVSPLKAKANSDERIRLTVFVLNNQGLGVKDKKVAVSTDPQVKVEAVQASTDDFGKSLFDISSSQKGEYYLQVSVETIILPQRAHLSFY